MASREQLIDLTQGDDDVPQVRGIHSVPVRCRHYWRAACDLTFSPMERFLEPNLAVSASRACTYRNPGGAFTPQGTQATQEEEEELVCFGKFSTQIVGIRYYTGSHTVGTNEASPCAPC